MPTLKLHLKVSACCFFLRCGVGICDLVSHLVIDLVLALFLFSFSLTCGLLKKDDSHCLSLKLH